MNLLHKLLLSALLTGAAFQAPAHTFMQVGVDSNLLVDSNRVFFAQADGSLTALALDTGEVLERNRSRYFSGTFRRIPEGILILDYGAITLLNPTNFAVIWETESHYEANVLSNSVVSYDGNGLVEHRNLSDGVLRWTYELSGALQVIATGDHVLIHRAATYNEELATRMVILDLESGRELWSRSPTPGTHWDEAFFDGERIYIKEGACKGKRSD